MKYKQIKRPRRKLMQQIRKGVRLNHISPKTRTEQRQTKNPNIKLPSPEEYAPLPRTWDDFQTLQSQYRGHPMWDLFSPQEYYKWTKDWAWDQVAGHPPTEEMRKKEWEPQPTYKQIDLEEAYLTSPLPARITQCMNAFVRNHASCDSTCQKKTPSDNTT
jgi:hypothetical protein